MKIFAQDFQMYMDVGTIAIICQLKKKWKKTRITTPENTERKCKSWMSVANKFSHVANLSFKSRLLPAYGNDIGVHLIVDAAWSLKRKESSLWHLLRYSTSKLEEMKTRMRIQLAFQSKPWWWLPEEHVARLTMQLLKQVVGEKTTNRQKGETSSFGAIDKHSMKFLFF